MNHIFIKKACAFAFAALLALNSQSIVYGKATATPAVANEDTLRESPPLYEPVETTVGPVTGYLNGSRLTMLSNQTDSQMLSVLIETNNGNLIMVDGGTAGDADYLADTLRAKGGHVDAWLITHPHSDHIGALYELLTNPDFAITIDDVYYSFPPLFWYQEYEPKRAGMVSDIMDAFSLLPTESLHGDIYAGQEIWVDNVKITVMNEAYRSSSNSINNSSVTYMLEINGKKALFLGDMGFEAGNRLVKNHRAAELKCDIVQMAHHGQYGVSYKVYDILQPEICLWSAPQWLWDNDSGEGAGSGTWKTLETRRWMAVLGVSYHLCIKDGDQVIE